MCIEGHYLSPESDKCNDCDTDLGHDLCRSCEAPKSGTIPRCVNCADGLNLDPESQDCKTCEQLTGVPSCIECDVDNRLCTACGDGFYLPEDIDGNKGRECRRCHD
jgi:hypothetical protein